MNRLISLPSLLAAVLASGLLVNAPAIEARTKLVDSWQNEDAKESDYPEKIAVIVVLPDGLIREAVEIDIVKKLKTKKRNVVEASKLPGLGGGIRGEINTERATKALKAAGADGVIVLFYSGGGVSGTYARSDYWLRYEGTGVGYAGYNWGTPYFTDVYSVQQGPGYSDFTRSALVESTYYDLETEEPIWRIVTETKDLEHSDAAKGIAKKIKSEMNKAGL
ncbi:MAG TPA: hypothetical protein VFG52_02200 [Xanthomonadales bacterium]|nr:hypothetical protein [Xanthomonadales bacterium]